MRRAMVLAVVVAALVLGGVVWWRLASPEPAEPTLVERLAAVPGVASAEVVQDMRLALLERDLDRASRERALSAMTEVLGDDAAALVGVEGTVAEGELPAADVYVGGFDAGDPAVLADLLPTMVAAVDGGAVAARGVDSDRRRWVELRTDGSAAAVAADYVRILVDDGRGDLVDEADVTVASPGGTETDLSVECAGGLGGARPALAEVGRIEDRFRARVVSGWVDDCGDDVYLRVTVPDTSVEDAVRRAVRSALGRSATVSVISRSAFASS